METGTVKFFSKAKGFGFIKLTNDESKEVFFHFSKCIDKVVEGDKVSFEMGEDKGRPCAVDVRRA